MWCRRAMTRRADWTRYRSPVLASTVARWWTDGELRCSLEVWRWTPSRRGAGSRFVEFTNEYPWRWRPLDLDQFLADLRSEQTPIALSTLRSHSNAISMSFYVSDGRYGWVAFCERQFGDVPSQSGRRTSRKVQEVTFLPGVALSPHAVSGSHPSRIDKRQLPM